MNTHWSALCLSLLALPFVACSSGPQVKIIKPNPETMVELNGQPQNSEVNGSAQNPAGTQAFGNEPGNADRLRLPDMETLPGNEELKPVKPRESGIIARPPIE